MLPAIARQLRMLAHAAATAATAATTALRRLFLCRGRRGGRDALVLELVLIEQPDPLRFRLRFGLQWLLLRPLAREPRSLILPQADQHFFAEPAIDGDQIRDQPDEHRLKSDDQKNGCQDQRLNVAAAIASFEKEPEESPADRGTRKKQERADQEERLQRFVQRVDPEDRGDRFAQVRA